MMCVYILTDEYLNKDTCRYVLESEQIGQIIITWCDETHAKVQSKVINNDETCSTVFQLLRLL